MVVVGLGSVATLREEERKCESKTVKKRTRDERRGNTRERDVLGTMTKGEEGGQ